jgi:hypothetical protein
MNNNSVLPTRKIRRKAMTLKNVKKVQSLLSKPPLSKPPLALPKNTRKLNKKKGIAFANRFLPNEPYVPRIVPQHIGINTIKLNRMIETNSYMNHVNSLTVTEIDYILSKL